MLRNASVCAFVIPVSTPSSRASRLTANTFVSGGAPARIATGLPRSSGSRRTTAWAGKSGTNRDAKAKVSPLSLVKERETNRTYLLLMVFASASERNRRVATALANESLLPELQILRTSKPLFQSVPRRGSICLLSAGTEEPTKRSFSHKTLHLTEAESLACFQPHGESETTCSN